MFWVVCGLKQFDTLYNERSSHSSEEIVEGCYFNSIRVVAGNGVNGSAPNQLSFLRGIFVDLSFDLCVSDQSNPHIQ